MTCGSQIRPGAEVLGWYWYADTHLYPLQLTFLFKGHHLWAPSCDFSLHIFMTHENDHFTAHLKCILMPNTLALSTWSDDEFLPRHAPDVVDWLGITSKTHPTLLVQCSVFFSDPIRGPGQKCKAHFLSFSEPNQRIINTNTLLLTTLQQPDHPPVNAKLSCPLLVSSSITTKRNHKFILKIKKISLIHLHYGEVSIS